MFNTLKLDHVFRYAVADIPYSVPLTIDTTALNTLLNELLKEYNNETGIEFDFIVAEKLLRCPLQEHLSEHGLSTELTVDVEYIIKNPPPEPEDCLLHDDWVSAVDLRHKWILTGKLYLANFSL